jgi:hypothetical protein
MAIAENCGHGHRGEIRYVRNADGTERIETRSVIERRERNKHVEKIERRIASKDIADDMPWISREYRRYSKASE